ncbi:MAG: ferredoxin [Bacilli bacterium]|jgi:ferredoxin|nr:ferredoxin [Bacilli bacterium]MDD4065695.1 ferredoxin [Bacilli bacterium]
MPKFVVKKDACIGCGLCAGVAEAVFTIGSDGLAEAINPDELDPSLVPAAEDALEQCPVKAIEKED